MADRSARSNRQVLKPVHTWIGIIGGVFLSVLGLTGSVILFRADFERAALPVSVTTTSSRRVGLDEAAKDVARFRPHTHIRRVRLPVEAGDPYIFQVDSSEKRTESIVVDASTGAILGVLRPGWVEWMVDLHRNLLSGKSGRKAVGVVGILLFVLSATGLLMWLTGACNWRAWVSVRRQGTTRRFHFELHRASGLWAYGFLAVMSFTGIGLAYPETFRQAVEWLTGKPAMVREPKRIKTESRRPLDDYLRAGRGAMPDGVPIELRLPETRRGGVDLRLRRAGDLAPDGNHVYLDPASANVIMVDRIADRPAGARFLAALSPIHYGEFGGMPIKLAWALLGLAPLLLFVTGLVAWWRPAKRKSSRPTPDRAEREEFATASVRAESR